MGEINPDSPLHELCPFFEMKEVWNLKKARRRNSFQLKLNKNMINDMYNNQSSGLPNVFILRYSITYGEDCGQKTYGAATMSKIQAFMAHFSTYYVRKISVHRLDSEMDRKSAHHSAILLRVTLMSLESAEIFDAE